MLLCAVVSGPRSAAPAFAAWMLLAPAANSMNLLHIRNQTMAQDVLPRTSHRQMEFDSGTAIGMSHRWHKGQYCSILTKAGIVGCGIYDLVTPAEFDQAIAIAKGTPDNPLCEPEDLLDAPIVGVTPKAASYGIQVGMTGQEAVEKMLQAPLDND